MRTADSEGSKGRSNSTHTTAKLDILRGEKSPGLIWALHRPLLVQSRFLCLVSNKARAQCSAAVNKAGQTLGTCRK